MQHVENLPCKQKSCQASERLKSFLKYMSQEVSSQYLSVFLETGPPLAFQNEKAEFKIECQSL